jgi:hypothetical protein
MDRFDSNCSLSKGHRECSEDLMKDLNLDYTSINDKVVDQIRKVTSAYNNSHVLREWTDLALRGNILFYPDVIINNVNYQGELNAPDIFQMLCNSLSS